MHTEVLTPGAINNFIVNKFYNNRSGHMGPLFRDM